MTTNIREYMWHYYRANKARAAEQGRKDRLRKSYGLTPEQYDEMLRCQGGRCAICAKRPKNKRLHVDHDHKTGKVRGLLCTRCNTGIVPFMENWYFVLRAKDYLESPVPTWKRSTTPEAVA